MCELRGQTLLSNIYKNIHETIEIKCKCNNIQEISLEKFLEGRACSKLYCEYNLLKLDLENNVVTKIDRTGEKNIDYKQMVDHIGYTLLSENPTDENDPCMFECKNGHKFESKMTIVKNILNNKKDGMLCKICDIISKENSSKVKGKKKKTKIVKKEVEIIFESNDD